MSATCPNCGKPVRPGTRFCGSCGAPIPASPRLVAPAGAVCPHCGKPVRPGAKFCSHCGKTISAGEGAAAAEPAVVQTVESGVQAPAAPTSAPTRGRPSGPLAPPAPTKSRKWLWLGLGLAGILVCGAVAVSAYLFRPQLMQLIGRATATATLAPSATPQPSSTPTSAPPSETATLSPVPTATASFTPSATPTITPTLMLTPTVATTPGATQKPEKTETRVPPTFDIPIPPLPSLPPPGDFLFGDDFGLDWFERWDIWGDPDCDVERYGDDDFLSIFSEPRSGGIRQRKPFTLTIGTEMVFVVRLPEQLLDFPAPFVLYWDPIERLRKPSDPPGPLHMEIRQRNALIYARSLITNPCVINFSNPAALQRTFVVRMNQDRTITVFENSEPQRVCLIPNLDGLPLTGRVSFAGQGMISSFKVFLLKPVGG